MTERPTDSDPRSGAGWPLVLLLLGPILYVASTGPVMWFVATSGIPPASITGIMIQIIYWPAQILAEEVSMIGDALTWYVELFLP